MNGDDGLCNLLKAQNLIAMEAIKIAETLMEAAMGIGNHSCLVSDVLFRAKEVLITAKAYAKIKCVQAAGTEPADLSWWSLLDAWFPPIRNNTPLCYPEALLFLGWGTYT
jgi:hypothetical protein